MFSSCGVSPGLFNVESVWLSPLKSEEAGFWISGFRSRPEVDGGGRCRAKKGQLDILEQLNTDVWTTLQGQPNKDLYWVAGVVELRGFVGALLLRERSRGSFSQRNFIGKDF